MYLLTKEKTLINLNHIKGIYFWGIPNKERINVVYEDEKGIVHMLADYENKAQANTLVSDIAKAMAEGLEVYAPFAMED